MKRSEVHFPFGAMTLKTHSAVRPPPCDTIWQQEIDERSFSLLPFLSFLETPPSSVTSHTSSSAKSRILSITTALRQTLTLKKSE